MSGEALLYWGVGLLLISLLILVIEVFIPSAGLLSLLSLGCAITGLVLLFRVDWKWGAAGLLSMLILVPTVFVFALQMLPSTPIGRRLIGAPPAAGDEDGPAPDGADPFAAMLGLEGVALTDLRPVGTVRFNDPRAAPGAEGERLSALAETAYIPAGTRVRVTAVEDAQIKVRPLA